jgi:periplasmic copper chaperone A
LNFKGSGEKMKKIILFTLLITSLFLSACTANSPIETGDLEVNNVWGRTSPSAATNGAFYMLLENKTSVDETLLSVSAEVCGATQLHEMYMKENDVMGMRPVEDGVILIPAGETVELKAGGIHVMCLDKQAEFMVGDAFQLTLLFESAGEKVVTAEIRDAAEGNMEMDEGMEHDMDNES